MGINYRSLNCLVGVLNHPTVHPWKLTCPLKRDYFSREYIFQPLIFRGHVSFQGGIYFHNWWIFVFHMFILEDFVEKPRLDTKALCTSHRSGSCILDFSGSNPGWLKRYSSPIYVYIYWPGVYLCITICMLPKILKYQIHRFGGDDQYFVYDMNLSRHVLFNNII